MLAVALSNSVALSVAPKHTRSLADASLPRAPRELAKELPKQKHGRSSGMPPSMGYGGSGASYGALPFPPSILPSFPPSFSRSHTHTHKHTHVVSLTPSLWQG